MANLLVFSSTVLIILFVFQSPKEEITRALIMLFLLACIGGSWWVVCYFGSMIVTEVSRKNLFYFEYSLNDIIFFSSARIWADLFISPNGYIYQAKNVKIYFSS